MEACYDLSRCPPTYDVVAFLALLDLERQARGEDDVSLHVLPGPDGGFRRDGLWPHTLEERRQVRDKVLVPLCRMLPCVRYVDVRDRRDCGGWGTGEYNIGLSNILRALRAGSRPLGVTWDYRRPDSEYITFTLREAEHHPLRNSRTDDWEEAAKILRERCGWRVIMIRDATVALGDVPGIEVDNRAAHDLTRRAELYASAALNVGISNGPMWMSIFMDAPTLMLRPTTNEAGGCYDDVFYARCGLHRGEQLPTSPSHQRLVWEEDYQDNIVRAVEEMMEVMG